MKTKYKKTKNQNNSLPDTTRKRYSLFQTLMDNIPDLIYIKDKNNCYIMVNKSMANFFGKEPGELIGKTDFDIAAEKSARESFKDDTDIIKSGKQIINKTEKIISSSGKEFWVSCSKIPWYDQKGKIMGTMGISRDITKSKEATEQLLSKKTQEAVISSYKKKLKKRYLRDDKVLNKIQGYAVGIGERLNLSKLKLEELRLLMNLHDIGKLALADEILSKTGSLNKEEWKIIKKLPEIGYRIAESSEQLKPIAEAILSHHEWYNGKGYPRGIKGEDIPILSRISFLVNSFEAMTSNRPYRKKMTYNEAINEIKKYSGKQFDPKVVDIFLNIMKESKHR